jgi:metaxin
MPSFVRTLYSHFPLRYNPAVPPPFTTPLSTTPVLWITPPAPSTSTVLSTDVECLKWQAYIALRGLNDVKVRWDIDPAGGVDGRLPNVWLPPPEKQEGSSSPQGEVLSARMIPGWADEIQGEHAWSSDLEGYIDEKAKDESRAWVSVLEGAVHAALVCRTIF